MERYEREYEVEIFGLDLGYVADESALGAEESAIEMAEDGVYGETVRELVAAGHRPTWTGATR